MGGKGIDRNFRTGASGGLTKQGKLPGSYQGCQEAGSCRQLFNVAMSSLEM